LLRYTPPWRGSLSRGAASNRAEIVDKLARTLRRDLVSTRAGAEPTGANAKVLRDMIKAHIDDEERRMFALVEGLGDSARARLGTRIERRADELEEGTDDDDPVIAPSDT
jgi:hypothetical protein